MPAVDSPNPARAVIYIRSSTAKGRSLSEQEAACRAECERHGWPVGLVVSDKVGASRWSKGERPGFNSLPAVLANGDVLVAWKATRTNRKLEDFLLLRAMCEARGILLCYSGRLYDMRVSSDRHAAGREALDAERDSDEIRDNVKRAMQENARDGKPHGQVAFGYRIMRDPETGRTIGRGLHGDEAPIVREMADWALAGDSLYSIQMRLSQRGVKTKTGKDWKATILRAILISPHIAGMRVHRGVAIGKGTWPAIITEKEHARLVAIYTNPARRVARGSRAVHLLSGIALCGVCNKACYRRKSNTSSAYSCESINGGHVSRKCEPLDRLVEKTLLHYVATPEIMAEVLAPADDDGELERLTNEIDTKQRELDDFIDTVGQPGGVSRQALARIEANLVPQIEELHRRRTKCLTNSGGEHPLAEMVQSTDPEAYWEGLPIERQRELLRKTFVIRILPTGATGHAFREDSITIDWA